MANIVVDYVVHKSRIQAELQKTVRVVSEAQVQASQEEASDKNQIGSLLESIMKMMTAGNYFHPRHY